LILFDFDDVFEDARVGQDVMKAKYDEVCSRMMEKKINCTPYEKLKGKK
jgi:hypothetical protein